MKIALVSDTYFPRINGVSVSMDNFAEEYRKLGHEVYIIAPHFPGHKDKDSHIIRIKSHHVFFDPQDRFSNPFSPSMSAKIKKEILGRKFDIIHTQTPFSLGLSAIFWAKQTGCPVVHTYHTLFESYVHYLQFVPQVISISMARRISRWYCNRMDLVIAPTKRMKILLENYKVRERIEVVPTGIKMKKPMKKICNIFCEKYPQIKKGINLLYMGRLEKEKNIDFLFYALKRLLKTNKDIKLIMAGGGYDELRLKDLARVMGLEKHVLFLGTYTDLQRPNILSLADIFVFSSVTETQGLVILEALSAGVPVVAVKRMGVAEVMEGNKGGMLTELSVDKFTEAVNKMIHDKKFYAQKKKEAMLHAKEWESSAMAKKMISLYREAIEQYNNTAVKKEN